MALNGRQLSPHAVPRTQSSPQIMQAVRDAGYTEPTPIQVAAIPLISAGHDIIGIAQTGTGKTAAFVLPILMKLAASKPNGQPAARARSWSRRRVSWWCRSRRTCALMRNTFHCAWPRFSAA